MPRTVKELRNWLSKFSDTDYVGTEGERTLRCFDRWRKTLDLGGFRVTKAPTKICPVKVAFRNCSKCGCTEECRDYA